MNVIGAPARLPLEEKRAAHDQRRRDAQAYIRHGAANPEDGGQHDQAQGNGDDPRPIDELRGGGGIRSQIGPRQEIQPRRHWGFFHARPIVLERDQPRLPIALVNSQPCFLRNQHCHVLHRVGAFPSGEVDQQQRKTNQER